MASLSPMLSPAASGLLYFIANLRCSTQCHGVTTNAIQIRIAWLYCTFTTEAENSPLCERQHGIRQAEAVLGIFDWVGQF